MEYQQDDEPDSIAGEFLETEADADDLVTATGEQMPSARHAERHDAPHWPEGPEHDAAGPHKTLGRPPGNGVA